MATKKAAKKASKTAAKKTSPRVELDAIQLLTQDHEEVRALFEEYDELVESEAEDDEKQELAQQICQMLSVHATVEEELFYSAARDVLGEDEDLVDEAAVEHASAKDLIAQIQSGSPADALYDAKVKVLGEYINHHVEEEEGEMFPRVKKAKLDTVALGAQLAERKEALMAEMGMGSTEEEESED